MERDKSRLVDMEPRGSKRLALRSRHLKRPLGSCNGTLPEPLPGQSGRNLTQLYKVDSVLPRAWKIRDGLGFRPVLPKNPEMMGGHKRDHNA